MLCWLLIKVNVYNGRARACFEVLQWCIQSRVKEIQVQTDSPELVRQLNNYVNDVDWQIKTILLHIR